jgi:hypothetical protein
LCRREGRDRIGIPQASDLATILATELIAEAKKFAQSNTYLAEREGFEPVHLKGPQSESKGEKIPYDPLMPPDLCTDLCTTLG